MTDHQRHSSPTTFVGIALLLLTVFSPVALAAPEQVDGLNALVTYEDASPEQHIQLRWPLVASDNGTGPDYNVTVGGVDVGDLDTVRDGFFGTVEVQIFGAAASTTFEVHAWDGVDEGTISCTATVNTGTLYDFDECGDMSRTYQEEHCFTPDSADNFGFTETYRVHEFSGDRVQFQSQNEESAWAGLNLGGDSKEYEFVFEIESGTEGSSTKALMFFSEVGVQVTSTSAGNVKTTVPSGYTIPNTGAFRNGLGASLIETGDDYTLRLFTNTNGGTTIHATELLTDGILANTATTGYLRVSEYAGIMEFSLGNEYVAVSTQDTGSHDNLQSFWLAEYGTGFFNTAYHRHTTDETSGCLNTLPATQGGAVIEPGAPSTGQGLEDFEGEGGFGGQPEFPGLDVVSISTGLGMDARIMGYILASVLVMALGVLGFLAAGGIGAGAGAILAVLGGFVLNLVPGWFIIVLLTMSVGVVVLTYRGQST